MRSIILFCYGFFIFDIIYISKFIVIIRFNDFCMYIELVFNEMNERLEDTKKYYFYAK